MSGVAAAAAAPSATTAAGQRRLLGLLERTSGEHALQEDHAIAA
ncbi:hypothetical protein ABZZ80_20355 [Streptomyces sp. NPDC006356]